MITWSAASASWVLTPTLGPVLHVPRDRDPQHSAHLVVLETMSIAAILDGFTAAFNRNDLDAVMAAFATDAVYCPGDGSTHRGRDAIRRAFAPQFAGAFGAMRFDPEDQLVDEAARKAALRWICRHDFSGAHGRRMSKVLRLLVGLRLGTRVGWRGVDVFHFDDAGKITGKYTYASYDRPKLQRQLGVPL